MSANLDITLHRYLVKKHQDAVLRDSLMLVPLSFLLKACGGSTPLEPPDSSNPPD